MTAITLPLPIPVTTPPVPSTSSTPSTSGQVSDAPVEGDDLADAEGAPTEFNDVLAALMAVSAAPAPVAPVAVAVAEVGAPAEPVLPDLAPVPTALTAVAHPVAAPTPDAAPTPVAPAEPVAAPFIEDAPEAVDAPIEARVAEVLTIEAPTAAPAPVVATVVAEVADDEPSHDALEVETIGEDLAAPDAAPAPEAVASPPVKAPVVESAVVAPVPVERSAPAVSDAPAEPAPAPTISADAATRAAPQPTAPLARTEAAVAPEPVAAPRVHTPIVTAVLPLVQRGDGSYRVAVRLHPAELGTVDLDVELRGGEINLRMRAESDAGRDALRAALPLLRNELEAAGMRAGTFDLRDRSSAQTPDHQRPGTPNRLLTSTGLPAEDEPTPAADAAITAAVDVRL